LSLALIGPTLEQFLGRVRFLVVYLISLLGGSVLVLVTTGPIDATAGASGAIFGVMGTLVVAFKRARLDLRQLVVVLAINLFITFQFSGISWQGHLGGLIAGALAGAVMVWSPRMNRTAWQVGGCAVILVLLAVVVAVRIGSIPPWSCFQQAQDYYCVPLRG
jgi:membrane associated rhomboid family serine protease